MPTETYINDLKINKPTRTQLKNATTLSSDQLYFENPEFEGGKLLATDSNGDIVEADDTPTTIQVLSATDGIRLKDGVLYQGGEQTSLAIVVPSTATVGFVAQITFRSGATPTAITVPQTGFIWDGGGEDVSGGVFTAVANKDYTFIIGYNGFNFVAYSSGV